MFAIEGGIPGTNVAAQLTKDNSSSAGVRPPPTQLRNVVAMTILFDLVAILIIFLVPIVTSSEVRILGGAAVMGTAYTVYHRRRAKFVGLLIWAVGGAAIGGIYNYIP